MLRCSSALRWAASEDWRCCAIWASLPVIAVAFAGCWIYSGELYEIASAPIRANELVTLSIQRPQDIFSLNVKVTLVAAIFLSAPLVLTQAWLFI